MEKILAEYLIYGIKIWQIGSWDYVYHQHEERYRQHKEYQHTLIKPVKFNDNKYNSTFWQEYSKICVMNSLHLGIYH